MEQTVPNWNTVKIDNSGLELRAIKFPNKFRTIELWIKNQPYSPSIGSITYHLYYDVRMKGHFEEDWTENNTIVELASMPYSGNSQITAAKYIPNLFQKRQT